MINDDLTKTLVRDHQRDLVRIARNDRFSRLVRRTRRKRNPHHDHPQPNAS